MKERYRERDRKKSTEARAGKTEGELTVQMEGKGFGLYHQMVGSDTRFSQFHRVLVPDKVLNHKRKAGEGKLMRKAYLYTFSNWTVDALAERLRQLWKMNDDFILMELQQSSCKAGITYTYQTTEIESRSGWGPLRIEQHLLLFPFKIKYNREKISL